MQTFLLILFLILFIASVLVNVNLLAKVESLEVDNEEIDNYLKLTEQWITQFSSKVNESYSRIKNIDRKGAFEADDEVGFIFKELKTIIFDLSKLTNPNATKEETEKN